MNKKSASSIDSIIELIECKDEGSPVLVCPLFENNNNLKLNE